MRTSFPKHVMLFLLVGWCLSVSCSSTAAALPDTQGSVITLLSGYEYVPTAEAFYQLGPGVPELLSRIVKNPQESRMLRIRALEALRHYPTHPVTEPTITHVLGESRQEAVFVRTALVTLADIGHLKATPKIVPYLSSSDFSVREGAAVALARTQDPSAKALLEKAATRENNDFQRNRLLDIVAEMNGQPRDTRNSTAESQSHPEWRFTGPSQPLSPITP